MSRRLLPSTSALLALETAARHQSFARAAEELSLSEGAISRQIAKLETLLGVQLFRRSGNRVELSPSGATYAARMRSALADIERHTQALLAEAQGRNALEIGVIPTLAGRWLIPRLASFRAQNPDVEINLRERTQPFSFAESGLHAAINYAHPVWQTMRVQPLFEEPMVAVCHASLAELSPQRMPLLHKDQGAGDWARYAELTGLPLAPSPAGPTYDRYALLIESARAGLGMALVPRRYVQQDLDEARLLAPWPTAGQLKERYVLVTRPDTPPTSALGRFERWLLAQIDMV